MKAAYLVDIGKFEIIETAKPQPLSKEVLIKVKAAGICGSDVHFYKDGRIGPTKAHFPYIIGHECSGVIEGVGESVDNELIGKRVAVEPAIYCYECEFCRSGKYNICPNVKFLGTPPVFGAYSEYITMPVKNIIPIPDEVSYDEGVMLEPLTICYHGIERIGREKIKKAKAITIIGCGPIGLSMIALIRAITDAMIFALDRIDYRLEKAKTLGANYTYNIEKTSFLDNILNKTKYGSDITIEAAGEEKSMYNAAEVTAPGGTVLIAGIPDVDNIVINAHTTRKKELDIKLLRRSNFNEIEASDYLKNNNEIVNSMITHNFALEDIKEAFDLVANYSDGAIKVIINP